MANETVNKTLHIIGVGGTGAKLINATVHLAASGVFSHVLGNNTKIDKIRVVAVDADTANGSRKKSGEVVDAYGGFYQAVVETNNNPLGLVRIERFKDIDLSQTGKKSIRETFRLPDFDLAHVSGADRLSRFLFTDDDIELEFDEGFYGKPSVGTLIVSDVLENDPGWKRFCEGNTDTGDTGLKKENGLVVVMGSIFGGTGASAIPVLLQKLEKIKREDNRSLKYAVLMCTPYFSTAGEDVKAPDARTFFPKAQAALHYYYAQYYSKIDITGNVSNPDAVYIIGEPEDNFSVEAKHAGAAEQENKPHVLELFAASALVDFAQNSISGRFEIIRTAEREKVEPLVENKEQEKKFGNTWKMVGRINDKLPDDLKRFMKVCLFYNKVLYREFGGYEEVRKNQVKSAGTWPFKYNKVALLEENGKTPVYELIHNYTGRFVQWFFDIHKMIKDSGKPVDWDKNWKPDTRVQLFFTGNGDADETKALYTGKVNGDKIDNFDKLVFGDEGHQTSEEIYAELCHRKPEKDKGFAALFGTLRGIIPESPGVGGGDKDEDWAYYLPAPSLNEVALKNTGPLWAQSKLSALDNIAENLPAVHSGKSNGVFGASDIQLPSPWSIFITQELALTNPAFGLLHDNAYRQWTGIIALLALRRLCRWDWEDAGPLELYNLKTDLDSTDFTKKVAMTLTPENKIFATVKWEENYALLLDLGGGKKETLAFLAHNTLACPAYSFSEEAWKKLRGIAPGLVDPDKNEFLSPVKYFAKTDQSDDAEARYGLWLFVNTLSNELGGVSSFLTGLNSGSAFVSDLQKKLTQYVRELNNPPRAGVEIDQGAKAGSVCEVFTNLIPQPAEWSVNKLFLDTLVLIKKSGNGEVFHSISYPLPDYEVIWPVSETLLGMVDDPALISAGLSITPPDQKSQKVKVTLNLSIPVSPGQPVINISKDYIKAEAGAEGQPGTWAEFDRAAIPLLAVWPYAEILDNSKDKKNTWHLYKYYCEELKIPGAFKIEPYFKDGKTIFKEPVITDLSADEFDTRYGESSSLPSALKLEFSSGTNDKFAGFVFLKKPQQKNQGAKKWDAALDFGTTSTTVFYKEGDDKKAEFLHLLTEYTWNNTGINKPPEPVIEGKEIGQEFKSRKICGSVTSNFEHFFIDKWCFAQSGYITAWEELNPQSGRVFWQNEDTYRIADVTAGARRHNNVKTDLKWDGDTDLPTKYLGHLLTHVTFAAAWQGVGTINWFCSYPTALSPNNEGRFRELILKELLGDTNTEKPKPGVLSKESTGIDVKFEEKAGFVTESEAVARYFMKEREHQPLYLCVDIGGGTSDISVWSQETGKVTYLFQSSVRFASGEMFVNPLKKLLNSSDPAVLDTVLKKEGDPIYRLNYFWGSGQDSGGKHSLHMNDAQLSAVLSEYADEVKKRLWEKNLISRDFTTYVTIAYSGLCFYLAHIIAALFKKNETPMPKEMVFGLSGRGAKLTEWIDADAVHKETEKLIPELFYRGKSGAPFTIMPKFSKEFAKMETAKGLLYGSNAPAEELPAEIYMGADVSFKKDGDEPKPREADDFISRGEDFVISPANWTASFDSGLNSLKEFVKFFDKVVHTSNVKGYKNVKVIGLGWLEENKAHLKTVIDNKFGETMHPQRISDARFESPFIVALKVLLSEYSEKELHFKENQNV